MFYSRGNLHHKSVVDSLHRHVLLSVKTGKPFCGWILRQHRYLTAGVVSVLNGNAIVRLLRLERFESEEAFFPSVCSCGFASCPFRSAASEKNDVPHRLLQKNPTSVCNVKAAKC